MKMNKNAYEKELTYYREELSNFFKMMLVGAIIMSLMIFGVTQLIPMERYHVSVLIVLAVVIMIPPVKMLKPIRPTENSFKYDQLLNQIARLSDKPETE
jgi:uncharacterized protein (DUF983 family)